jgi:hypothetical protein
MQQTVRDVSHPQPTLDVRRALLGGIEPELTVNAERK